MKLYYKDSLSSLTQGECIEVMTKMAEKGLKFDAIITDPPYGISRNSSFKSTEDAVRSAMSALGL